MKHVWEVKGSLEYRNEADEPCFVSFDGLYLYKNDNLGELLTVLQSSQEGTYNIKAKYLGTAKDLEESYE